MPTIHAAQDANDEDSQSSYSAQNDRTRTEMLMT